MNYCEWDIYVDNNNYTQGTKKCKETKKPLNIHQIEIFKYCPHCGKEIRINININKDKE